MEKKDFILMGVLIVAAVLLASNLGDTVTGQQVRGGFSCGTLQGDDEHSISTAPGIAFPTSAQVFLGATTMPNALKSSIVYDSTLTQVINTKGTIDFLESNAPIDHRNFFVHIPDGQPLADYIFIFTPTIPLNRLRGQEIYLLGKTYRVQQARRLHDGKIKISLQSCVDVTQSSQFVELVGSATSLQVTINDQSMEDVRGRITLDPSGNLQSILYTIHVDGIPGYSGLWLEDSDLELFSLLDEPQSLLGLDAEVFASLYNQRQPVIQLEYVIPFY